MDLPSIAITYVCYVAELDGSENSLDWEAREVCGRGEQHRHLQVSDQLGDHARLVARHVVPDDDVLIAPPGLDLIELAYEVMYVLCEGDLVIAAAGELIDDLSILGDAR